MNRTVFRHVIDKLAGVGVTNVIVTYAGSGDSGWIDDIKFHDPDGTFSEDIVDDVEVEIEKKVGSFRDNAWHEMSQMVKGSLREIVESFCHEILEHRFPGWEINEGSDGQFEIDVQNAEMSLIHNQNETVQNTSELEWKLGEDE